MEIATLFDDASRLGDILIDAEQMSRVLANLLANALHHSSTGGRIELAARSVRGEIELSVTDSGAGIAPEALPHIFDRFYRAEASRSRDEGGTGLGLAIAKSIVEAHGATLRVESEIGRGSTFTIRLRPAADAAKLKDL